jgi:hypothetical protein
MVITSSCGAMKDWTPTPISITEETWNEGAIEECNTKGKDAQPIAKYSASKTLSEKGALNLVWIIHWFLDLNTFPIAAWDFIKTHKGEIGWDLTVINPPWTFGVRGRVLTLKIYI